MHYGFEQIDETVFTEADLGVFNKNCTHTHIVDGLKVFLTNRAPQIHRLHSMLLAEALRIQHSATLLTETDEHGIKVFKARMVETLRRNTKGRPPFFRRLVETLIKRQF